VENKGWLRNQSTVAERRTFNGSGAVCQQDPRHVYRSRGGLSIRPRIWPFTRSGGWLGLQGRAEAILLAQRRSFNENLTGGGRHVHRSNPYYSNIPPGQYSVKELRSAACTSTLQ